MDQDLALMWPLCAAVFVLAGGVKGATGMGLPTVVMAILAGFLPAPLAAALLVVPSLVTNLQQLLAGPALPALLARLWPMLLAMAAATALAAPWLAESGHAISPGCLGLVLIAYALQALRPRPWAVAPAVERWLGPVVGALAGGVGSASGVFLVPSVPYLQALGLSRDALVQALSLSFTVSTLALAAVLLRQGVLDGTVGLWSLAMLPPSLLGLALGGWIRSRISAAAFRRGFLLCLVVLGGELAWRAWG